MVIDALFLIISSVIQLIYGILLGLTFTVSPYIQVAIQEFVSTVGIAQGFLPIYPDASLPTTVNWVGHPVTNLAHYVGIMTIFGWTLTFIGLYFSLRILAHWILPALPFLHINLSHPSLHMTSNEVGESIRMNDRFRKTMKGPDRINTRLP